MIHTIVCNHTIKSYFGYKDDLATSYCYVVYPETIDRAIDKQVRLHRSGRDDVVLFFMFGENSEVRLMYDKGRYLLCHTYGPQGNRDVLEQVTPRKAKRVLKLLHSIDDVNELEAWRIAWVRDGR